MTTIDTHTLRDWQSRGRDFILVDTLPADSFAKGHLPGAINIVSDDILNEAPRWLPDKQATIVVYCASEDCKRAGRAAERLARLGYTEVYHYRGGKRAWLADGLPLQD
ncbi:rhodanese-like domain-containing protein [Halomonas nitroreducens]|uniref:Rhodanese-like domain-containing protein n=1 Tax=Halomonas nitroreducens TaxID=447425 RepID=A0A3S0J7X6_9GAMM|nr:rhodanese-like domain-containing protein [Halomonas nitroreducens]RTR00173.1 rhodanese-like domain-containing protein [Halomonas nitroreducens]